MAAKAGSFKPIRTPKSNKDEMGATFLLNRMKCLSEKLSTLVTAPWPPSGRSGDQALVNPRDLAALLFMLRRVLNVCNLRVIGG